jgi:hypothetical protein
MPSSHQPAIYRGQDWTGKVVNHYTVLGRSEKVYYGSSNRFYWTWLVQCQCGSIKHIHSGHIVSGVVKGCNDCIGRRSRGPSSHNWKGGKHVSAYYFTKVLHSAQKRNIAVEVTLDCLDALFEKQNGMCALTGLPLQFGLNGHDCTASLDRKDSHVPYVECNVQWVHKDVNLMKMQLSESRLFELCSLIVTKQRGVNE